MPKDHKPSNFKQHNKPYKGSSKRQAKDRQGKILKKAIRKQPVVKEQKLEEEKQVQKQEQTQQPNDISKKQKIPKIVAVISLNQSVDMLAIKQQIESSIGVQPQAVTSYITQNIFLRVDPQKNIPFLKNSLQFVFPNRDLESILDACKVADIICPVLSCRNTNVEGLALDPQRNAQAYDDFGYRTLSNLRVQGLLPQVCLIQHLEEIAQNKRNQVKKFFQRYFQSEFGNDTTIIPLETNQQVQSILRFVTLQPDTKQEWRDMRGYMLPDDLQNINNQLVITGVWRGQTGLSANQLIHITGIDDFIIDRIELVKSEKRNAMQNEDDQDIVLIRDEEIAESLDPLCKKQGEQEIGADFLKEIEGLGLGEDDNKLKQQEMEGEDEEIEEQMSDVSYEQDDEEQDPDEKLKLQKFEIEKRNEEELEFEDEVEYGMDVQLRERYKKYQGLKNLRSSNFDPYTFLPDEVDKIYNVRNLNKVRQNVLEEMAKQNKIQPGQRIRIYIRGFSAATLQQITQPGRICVVSGVLKHERKMTQMHVKIKKHLDFSGILKSKSQVEIQVGFRRAKVEPIYSRILTNSNKSKFVKQVKDDQWYLASFYFLCTFPPQKVLFYSSEFDKRNGVVMATGDLFRCDAFQIIMKRIILTGYPYKINKRKAVVRLMFFNPLDIRYFQSVDLSTKLGLRGNILEPLGTHGLMKCMFNTFVKPNDTICLNLYRRVHPRFPQTLQNL